MLRRPPGSQCFEQPRKIFRGGLLEAEGLGSRRMLETQYGGVQSLASESGERRAGAFAEQRGLGFEP